MLPTPQDSAEVRRLKAEVKRLTEERDLFTATRRLQQRMSSLALQALPPCQI